MPAADELFGSPEQVALMQRGNQLWELLRDNPRYSSYGRMVSLCEPDARALDQTVALVRLQGATSCQYYPADTADRFCAAIEAGGLRTSRYEQCRGEAGALAASRRVLDDSALPDELTLVAVDKDTSSELVADLAALSIACGVMPVPGTAMRGQSRRGICLAAVDAAGKVVATASSYMSNHPESAHANDAFWGMLATHEDWRGKGIAKVLGAHSIVWMWENLGARSFNTGITADNAASLAMCAKLGVTPSQWTFIGCMDPDAFGTGSITR